jgi:hypothetical protein
VVSDVVTVCALCLSTTISPPSASSRPDSASESTRFPSSPSPPSFTTTTTSSLSIAHFPSDFLLALSTFTLHSRRSATIRAVLFVPTHDLFSPYADHFCGAPCFLAVVSYSGHIAVNAECVDPIPARTFITASLCPASETRLFETMREARDNTST